MKGGTGGQGSLKMVGPSDWLYAANQLGQFLNLADPAIHHDDKGDATFSRQPGDLLPEDGKLDWPTATSSTCATPRPSRATRPGAPR